MPKDYIKLAGKQYRVEVNWNSLMDFMQSRGTDNFEALSLIDKLAPSDLAGLMAACINEGERLDGRECHLTSQDVGALGTPVEIMNVITEFFHIYQRHTAPDLPEDTTDKKKKVNP